jgi:hypothetical protein
MTTIQTGIIENMGAEYHALTATPSSLKNPVSKSMLWDFYKSPFKWFFGYEEKQITPAMEFGSAVHSAALTPEAFRKDYACSPFDSWRTKESQEYKKDAESNGITILKDSDFFRAIETAEAVMSDFEMPKKGEYSAEVAVFGKIGNTLVKGMLDIVPHDDKTLYDIKTTANIESLDDLQKTILNRGYHWQAALYLDLWNAATGETRDQFVFAFVETSSPHETAFVLLSKEFLDLGRFGGYKSPGYMQALITYERCVEEDNWKKRICGTQEINVPAWINK